MSKNAGASNFEFFGAISFESRILLIVILIGSHRFDDALLASTSQQS
jgi:hypothetical protein